MPRETYRQAIRNNSGRPTCPLCFRPQEHWKPCDSCYGELSKAGQLLERTEPCKTSK